MRYSKEFILECIDLYREGKWPETPEGIKDENFRQMIRRWERREQAEGLNAFGYKNRLRSPEEKLDLVSQVIAGKPIQSVALAHGISFFTGSDTNVFDTNVPWIKIDTHIIHHIHCKRIHKTNISIHKNSQIFHREFRI